ncbi:MAG: DUF342 domain-containing protein [Phycisphaeraceae bacterium]|nr:MAG: DUF342 domain-containing protein [Phycisphaeraceae bacterium]
MSTPNDITVIVRDHGLRAEVVIPPGHSPAQITPDLLRTIAAGVKVEINPGVERRLAEACAAYASATEGLTFEIARATPPVKGSDASWVWTPAFDPGAALQHAPGEADGGRTDHRASHVPTLKAGTVIATCTTPTDGTDGRDVTGAVLKAERGKSSPIKPGAGVEVRPDGAVVATVDGALSVAKGVVSVMTVLEVAGSVDFATGNIDFTGDVRVADSVRDGFTIKATGNLTIGGSVEGAEITCGADFVCPRGVASARRATIAVGGNASVGYLRNVAATIEGDLVCRGEIEHCEVTVLGTFDSGQGRVIGGSIIVPGDARIGTLGSPEWTPTSVYVGVLPVVATELKRLDAESVRLKKLITAKEEDLRHLQSCGGGKGANAREQVTELLYEASEARRELQAIDAERARIVEATRAVKGVSLRVERIVYPHVKVHQGDSAYEFVKELKGPVQFIVDEHGALRVRVASLAPRPITDFARSAKPGATAATASAAQRKCA